MSPIGSLVGSIAVLGVAFFQAAPNEVEDTKYARFQGTWKIVSIECGGKSDNQDIEKYTIKFNGTTMIFREADGDNDEAAVRYKLSDRHCSKKITFGGVSATYDFRDGNLFICYSISGDRPTELRTTTDRPEEVLMILKRIGQQ